MIPESAPIDPAEQLLTLILAARTLTDEQKDAYAGELRQGRLHPELEANYDVFLAAEAEASRQELEKLQEEEAFLQEQSSHLQTIEDAAAESVVADAKKDMEVIVAEHANAGNVVVRDFDRDEESAARSGEAGEMDAIRDMLSKKKQ